MTARPTPCARPLRRCTGRRCRRAVLGVTPTSRAQPRRTPRTRPRDEHVMVHRASGEALATASLEDVPAWFPRVPLEVVEREHLLHVCQIILCGLQLSIPAEMLESRDRPTMIEGAIPHLSAGGVAGSSAGARTTRACTRRSRAYPAQPGADTRPRFPGARTPRSGRRAQAPEHRQPPLRSRSERGLVAPRGARRARAPGDGSCAHCLSNVKCLRSGCRCR